jgi:hypothetical protein
MKQKHRVGGYGIMHTVGRPQDGNELKSLARVLAVAMVPSEETLSMVAVGLKGSTTVKLSMNDSL